MKRILAAVDFSDVTGEVVYTAANLARRLEGSLQLIHTEPPVDAVLSYGIDAQAIAVMPDVDVLEAKATEDKHALEAIRDHIATQGLVVDCKQVEGRAVETIVAAAAEYEADLIVIGSHEHGAFYHLLMGGVRDSLINQSPCPVLVVPHRKKEQE